MKFALLLLCFGQARAWTCDDLDSSGVRLSLTYLSEDIPCNDGSSANYYYRASENPSNLTIVYLSGGGQCSDEESCSNRFAGSAYPYHDCNNSNTSSPCFMSSKDNGEECVKGGILAEMADRGANIAYVPYCSSDGWMGDQEFNGWEMRGSRIALGVVEDVVARGGGKVERSDTKSRMSTFLTTFCSPLRSSQLKLSLWQGGAPGGEGRRYCSMQWVKRLMGLGGCLVF